MTIPAVLRELGVGDDTLTPEEKASLDREGFVYLHGLFTAQQAERMLAAIQECFAREKTGTPGHPGECSGLHSKTDAFDVCVTHPRMLAAAYHVLRGELMSQGVHSRPNPPGKGHQGLHQDGANSCNSIWPLTDFTVENGATRVVPGSHLWGRPPEKDMPDVLQPHPQEVRLLPNVGTVAVFNGHLWHSAMPNHSKADRPNVTSFWAIKPTIHFNAALGPEAKARLGKAAWALFPEAAP